MFFNGILAPFGLCLNEAAPIQLLSLLQKVEQGHVSEGAEPIGGKACYRRVGARVGNKPLHNTRAYRRGVRADDGYVENLLRRLKARGEYLGVSAGCVENLRDIRDGAYSVVTYILKPRDVRCDVRRARVRREYRLRRREKRRHGNTVPLLSEGCRRTETYVGYRYLNEGILPKEGDNRTRFLKNFFVLTLHNLDVELLILAYNCSYFGEE